MSDANYPDTMSVDGEAETAATPRWLRYLVVAVVAGVWAGFAGGLSWWWGWRMLFMAAGMGVTLYVASCATEAACARAELKRQRSGAEAAAGR